MSKISLVSRRKSRAAAPPTRARERARLRLQSEKAIADIITGDRFAGHDVAVSVEEGVPTVALHVPGDQRVSLEELASEYLKGEDKTSISAKISEEKIGDQWELKLQFSPEEPARMMTTQQLAAMLGISTQAVLSLRKRDGIKGYKVGNSWRFIWQEVVEALEAENKE